jgi:hypothetical protein
MLLGAASRRFALAFLLYASVSSPQSGQDAQSGTNRIEERIANHVNRDKTAVGSRIDWVRKADHPYPLKSPTQDGSFQAVGIRGQAIYVNPAKRIVIAQFSAWPAAGARPEHRGESNTVFRAIVDALPVSSSRTIRSDERSMR